MTKRRLVTKRLACTMTSGLLLLSGINLALADGALDETSRFEIAEQPLDQALLAFSEQADIQIVMAADTTRDLPASGFRGEQLNREVLEQLLDDSGLAYTEHHNRTVAVHQTAAGEGSSESGNVPTMPGTMLMAQASANEITATPSSNQNSGVSSVVSGKVTDARTGANLKGAKVTIEETGQWTNTNNLGEFRFPSVEEGKHTITVSFLGLASRSESVLVEEGRPARVSLSMSHAAAVDEIFVFGTRSARAQALNQERTAANVSTVLSSDNLGQFSGTTISDALRRAPGVAFVPDSETGDGANVILRGLEPSLNQVLLNGVRLPVGSGVGRAPALNSLLTDSIDKVTISKTLLPNHDSNGAGGLVEIETRSPLDRPKRFVNFGYEHTSRGEDYGDGFLVSGTLSAIFGESETTGASISVQYREQNITRIGYDTEYFYGQYLPAGISDIRQIDPTMRFPFEAGVDLAYPEFFSTSAAQNQTDNLSTTITLEKQIADHTNLRFDFTRTDIKKTDISRTAGASVPLSSYLELPIAELGDELRYVLVAERDPSFPVQGVLANITRNVAYQPDNEDTLNLISLRGATALNRWSFNYQLGFSNGESDDTNVQFLTGIDVDTLRNPLQPGELTPGVEQNTVDGLLVSIFEPIRPNMDPGFVFPGFADGRLALVNDEANNVFSSGSINVGDIDGKNERVNANASARYDFRAGPVRYVEIGGFLEDTEFTRVPPPVTLRYLAEPRVTRIADVGLQYEASLLEQAGLSRGGFSSISIDSIRRFVDSLEALADSGVLGRSETEVDEFTRNSKTKEREFAPYLQGKVDIGRLEVVGGVRVSFLDLDSDFRSSPTLIQSNGTVPPGYREMNTQLVRGSESFTDVLPRIAATYRFGENVLARLGYFVSVNRPSIQQITRNQSAVLDLREQYGPGSDQPQLTISQGNPNLKPAKTHSTDLSFEWYDTAVGVIKLGAFYKHIDNPLETNNFEGDLELSPFELDLPSAVEFQNLPDNIIVDAFQPVNSPNDARIWGIEASLERQLEFLPGAWSGLGVFANYTYTDSSRTRRVFSQFAPDGVFIQKDQPFDGSPKHSGTVAMTYIGDGFDTSLAYSYQDRRFAVARSFGLDRYFDEFDSLDLSVSYLADIRGAKVRFYLEGNDLLKGRSDPTLSRSEGGENGVPLYEGVAHSYFGGRFFILGVSTTF